MQANSITIAIDIEMMSDPSVSKALLDLSIAVSSCKNKTVPPREVPEPVTVPPREVPRADPQHINTISSRILSAMEITRPSIEKAIHEAAQSVSHPQTVPKEVPRTEPPCLDFGSMISMAMRTAGPIVEKITREATQPVPQPSTVSEQAFTFTVPPVSVVQEQPKINFIHQISDMYSQGKSSSFILEMIRESMLPIVGSLRPGTISTDIKNSIEKSDLMPYNTYHQIAWSFGVDIEEQDNKKLLSNVITAMEKISSVSA